MAKDLTKGDIPRSLFELAWPMAIGILAVMGFNVVDTYFVGQLGTKELAAMSFTFPVVTLIGSLAIGIGISLSSMVSRAFGAKQFDLVRAITSDGLLFSILVVSCITVTGLLTLDPVFRFLGADGETLVLIKRYMRIWYFNVFFVVVPMVGNGAIRATGNTRIPAVIMVMAGLVNLVFDPILIFGWGPFPRLELEGAAIATVLSRATALVAALYVLHFKENLLTWPFSHPPTSRRNWRELAALSVPASLGNAIVPLSLFIITAFAAQYGEQVVAGFGVGTRVEILLMVVLMGTSSGLGPFCGQNAGAGKWLRVQAALRGAHLFSIAWTLLAALAVYFFGNALIQSFSDDPKVVATALFYIQVVVLSLMFEGVLLNINSALNAIGNARLSMALSTIRMVVLYVPLALLLQPYFMERGIFYASAAANVGAGIVAWLVFRHRYESRHCGAVSS